MTACGPTSGKSPAGGEIVRSGRDDFPLPQRASVW